MNIKWYPVLTGYSTIPKTSYYWRKVISHLTPYYTVVVPDLRGFGDSSRPLTGYDMGTVADDMVELMKVLGYDKFHMIGEDWGAAAGYQLAVRHPDRVISLIFQEMMLPGFGLEEWAKPHSTHAGPHLWQVGFYYVPDLPEFLIAGREKEYFKWFLKCETYDPSQLDDDDAIEEYASKFAQPGGLRGMCAYFREPESLKQNHESTKKKLTLPVLAIGAELFKGGKTSDGEGCGECSIH